MKILHVIGTLDPAGGGPPKIAASLAAAQAAIGHTVTLACHPTPDGEQRIAESLAGIPGWHAVRMVHIPDCPGLGQIVGRSMRPSLVPLVEDAEAVHLHSVWEPVLRFAAIEAHRRNRPYFVLLNGMLDPWSLSQKWLKKRIALAVGYRKMLSRASALHLGNADERSLIEPLHLPVPGEVIPNGVNLDEIEPLPQPGEFCSAVERLKGRNFVLFLSRLHFKKGLDYLTDAFARVAGEFPDTDLVIAGPNGGERGPTEARIDSLGLKERVHLVGPIYGRMKYAAMVDARCFCLPSRQEGFSMAITEALAVGCPVVISRNCHFPEVAEAGAGEVVSLDAQSVADALRRVLGDSERRRKMSMAGRQLVRERYTWPKIAAHSIEVYRRYGATD